MRRGQCEARRRRDLCDAARTLMAPVTLCNSAHSIARTAPGTSTSGMLAQLDVYNHCVDLSPPCLELCSNSLLTVWSRYQSRRYHVGSRIVICWKGKFFFLDESPFDLANGTIRGDSYQELDEPCHGMGRAAGGHGFGPVKIWYESRLRVGRSENKGDSYQHIH